MGCEVCVWVPGRDPVGREGAVYLGRGSEVGKTQFLHAAAEGVGKGHGRGLDKWPNRVSGGLARWKTGWTAPPRREDSSSVELMQVGRICGRFPDFGTGSTLAVPRGRGTFLEWSRWTGEVDVPNARDSERDIREQRRIWW